MCGFDFYLDSQSFEVMSCDESHIGTRLGITVDGVVGVGIELSLVVVCFFAAYGTQNTLLA